MQVRRVDPFRFERPKGLRPDADGVKLLVEGIMSQQKIIDELTAPLVDPSRVGQKELPGIQRVVLETYFPQTYAQFKAFGGLDV